MSSIPLLGFSGAWGRIGAIGWPYLPTAPCWADEREPEGRAGPLSAVERDVGHHSGRIPEWGDRAGVERAVAGVGPCAAQADQVHGATKRDWGDQIAIETAKAREAAQDEARTAKAAEEAAAQAALAQALFGPLTPEDAHEGQAAVLASTAMIASGRAMLMRMLPEAQGLARLAEVVKARREMREAKEALAVAESLYRFLKRAASAARLEPQSVVGWSGSAWKGSSPATPRAARAKGRA